MTAPTSPPPTPENLPLQVLAFLSLVVMTDRPLYQSEVPSWCRTYLRLARPHVQRWPIEEREDLISTALEATLLRLLKEPALAQGTLRRTFVKLVAIDKLCKAIDRVFRRRRTEILEGDLAVSPGTESAASGELLDGLTARAGADAHDPELDVAALAALYRNMRDAFFSALGWSQEVLDATRDGNDAGIRQRRKRARQRISYTEFFIIKTWAGTTECQAWDFRSAPEASRLTQPTLELLLTLRSSTIETWRELQKSIPRALEQFVAHCAPEFNNQPQTAASIWRMSELQKYRECFVEKAAAILAT